MSEPVRPPPIRFLLDFAGRRALTLLFSAAIGMLLLDLAGIAVVFPYLQLMTNPQRIAESSLLLPILELFHGDTGKFLAVLGVTLVVGYIVKLGLMVLLTRLKFRTSNNVTRRLACDLFQELLSAKYSALVDSRNVDAVTIINSHTVNGMLCLEAWVALLSEASFLTIAAIVFLIIEPGLTLIALAAFAVVGVVLYFGLVRRSTAIGRKHAALVTSVYAITATAVGAIKDIKIMNLGPKFRRRFDDTWSAYSSNYSRFSVVKAAPKDVLEALVFAGIIAVGLYVLVSGREFRTIVPALGVAGLTMLRALPSFTRIATAYNDQKFYRASLEEVINLHDTLTRNRHDIAHRELPFETSIELRDVSFKYGDKVVIDHLALTIPRGGSTAFIGGSGTGKSTILDVLMGVREATTGTFLLDGVEFDPFRSDALTAHAGYVPQKVNLMDSTIAFNIAFEDNYDRAKMTQVIEAARLRELVDELPAGLDTMIGEDGVRLSGGQRQRIGLARALYRDPVLIVLDEATSALDPVSEREILAELQRLPGARTLVVVTHRISAVKWVDRIHLLADGKIIASGTHDELLATSPEFRALSMTEHIVADD